MHMKPVCIIPARGGSKRIPRKNIVDFNGRPMIGWPIETALASGLFSQVVVTTDDEEIAEVARKYGAAVPFIRDEKLADDFATTADVLADCLNRLPATDFCCCLYPTAPMITTQNLVTAWQLLKENNAHCVLTVTEFDFHPLRAFTKNPDASLAFHWPEHALTRSQDLPEMLHDAGGFYFFRVESLQQSKQLIGENTFGLPLSRSQAVDIDTPEDLDFARLLHRIQIEGGQQ
ncbi:MAG: pseudaminic acid cytidylyltransferase [Pseudomonadota bacterium]